MSLRGAQRRSNPLAPRDCFDLQSRSRNDTQKGDAMAKHYYVYIMTNAHNTVLYTGVTNDLARRVYEHKNGIGSAFTKRYNVHKLVYYEIGNDVNAAIAREKQIKGGSRQKKIDLINRLNPEWKDLYEEII
jgi:putative endonuclease